MDSLCVQNLENIEFLLVDDGSPDRCGEIIKKQGYSSEKLESSIASAALSYVMRIRKDPNDKLGLRAAKTLKEYKKIPKYLHWQQKVMMFLYVKNLPLFDVCCVLLGKRLH